MPRFFFRMSGKPFHFWGCGWSRKKEVSWSKDDMAWIFTINDLIVQHNVWQGCSFLWIWQRFKTSGNITWLFTYMYQYDHALWEQLFPTVLTSFTSLLEQPQSPQSIPASSPASSNTDPVSSSSTSLSSSPATSPSNSSCSPSSSVTVDTRLPLFLSHQNLCLFMIYELVLQMIVPEANLLPLIFHL